jgi:hypothetical protein
MKKARLARKPKLLFNGSRYMIEQIPLNFRIIIKLPKQNKFKKMDNDFYTSLRFGLNLAHEEARLIIKRYFTDGIQR